MRDTRDVATHGQDARTRVLSSRFEHSFYFRQDAGAGGPADADRPRGSRRRGHCRPPRGSVHRSPRRRPPRAGTPAAAPCAVARRDRPPDRDRAARTRDGGALHPPGGGVRRRRRPAERGRGHADRSGQDALLQPAGPRRHRCRTRRPARSTSSRPRRSPQDQLDGAARPGAARREIGSRRTPTTATRRRTSAASSGPPGTSCSRTRTCCTRRSFRTTRSGSKLFENLEYVVIDELHTYRGVFGSHVGERPAAAAAHLPASTAPTRPSSALGHHRESRVSLPSALVGADVELVDDNGAPSGDRKRGPVTTRRSSNRGARHPRSSSLLRRRAIIAARLIRRRRADHRLRAEPRTASRCCSPTCARPFGASRVDPQTHRRLSRRLPAERAPRDRERAARRPGPRRRRDERARARHRHRRAGRGVVIGYPGTVASTLAADWAAPDAAHGASAGRARRSSSPLDQFLGRAPRVPLRTPARARTRSTRTTCYVLLSHLQVRGLRAAVRGRRSASASRTRPSCSRSSSRRTACIRRSGRSLLLDDARRSRPSTSACGRPRRTTSSSSTPPATATASSASATGSPPRCSSTRRRSTSTAASSTRSSASTGRSKKAYVTPVAVDYYTDAELAVDLKVLEVFDEADPPPGRPAPARRGHGRVARDHLQEAQATTPTRTSAGARSASPSRRCTRQRRGSCRPPSS